MDKNYYTTVFIQVRSVVNTNKKKSTKLLQNTCSVQKKEYV